MIDILHRIFRRRSKTSVQENLRFYIGFSDGIISLGLFSYIFFNNLQIDTYFGVDGKIDLAFLMTTKNFWSKLDTFLVDKWMDLTMCIFVFIWFLLYKRAVKNEMEILVSLYSRFNPPHNWEDMVNKKYVPVLSVGLTITFIILAIFIDKIEIFCLVMLFLNVLDTYGNNLTRRNLVKSLSDERFIPLDSDLHKHFIMERRKIAEEYWVWKPQIERIGLMMMGVVLALILSSSERILGFPLWNEIPYFILISIIILNEYTIGRWRIERDQELERVDLAQEQDERSRTE